MGVFIIEETVAATVRLSGQFRSAAKGCTEAYLQGETVAEILEALCLLFPNLREKIFDGDGQKLNTINVYLNREDIRYVAGLASTVADDDEIILLSPASGG